MRYVIVCVVKGEAGNFNNNLRRELWNKFKVKSSKLPAHFTLKAPFEYEGDIYMLEDILETFCEDETTQSFKIDGYDHFDDRVVYMKVIMSEEGKSMYNRFVEKVSNVPYIEFTQKDGKEKIFHVTLASKKLQPIYNQVSEYVQKYPCSFNCLFDNISIYKWEEHTWKLHKELYF